MTPDADVAKLLGAVVAFGARAIIVGDFRQLDAVGPGGALEALARRHPDHTWRCARTCASATRPNAKRSRTCEPGTCPWRRPGTY